MKNVGRTLSDDDIRALERRLAVGLPEDYAAFLRQSNGGRPDLCAFSIYGYENYTEGGIQVFFGVDRQPESSALDWIHRIYRGRIPTNLFPIACTGTGDLICLSLFGADKGAVVYWDHDAEHLPPSYDNVYPIANTFKSFLDSLRPDTPLDELMKQLSTYP